ncbi:hypothetical protein H1R20_g14070, partial [Candolleomyces eurysporus]
MANLYQTHAPFVKTAAASVPQQPPPTSTAVPLEGGSEAGPSLLKMRHCESCLCWLPLPVTEEMKFDLDLERSESPSTSSSKDDDPTIMVQDRTLTTRDIAVGLTNDATLLNLRDFEAELEGYQDGSNESKELDEAALVRQIGTRSGKN